MIKFEVGKTYPEATYQCTNYKVISRFHNPREEADYVAVISDSEFDTSCRVCKVLESNDVERIYLGNYKTDFAECFADGSVTKLQAKEHCEKQECTEEENGEVKEFCEEIQEKNKRVLLSPRKTKVINFYRS